MQLTLRYAGLQGRRAIISLPYWVGIIQGFFLEKLPESLFTVTRDQVSQAGPRLVISYPSLSLERRRTFLRAGLFPSTSGRKVDDNRRFANCETTI